MGRGLSGLTGAVFIGFAGGPCGLFWWGTLVYLLAPWCCWRMLVWAGTIV